MTGEIVEFSVMQRSAEDDVPGAIATFPFDRATTERIRGAFPRPRGSVSRGHAVIPPPFTKTNGVAF